MIFASHRFFWSWSSFLASIATPRILWWTRHMILIQKDGNPQISRRTQRVRMSLDVGTSYSRSPLKSMLCFSFNFWIWTVRRVAIYLQTFLLKIQFLTRDPLARRGYRKCTLQISMYTFLENGEWFREKIEDLGRIWRTETGITKVQYVSSFNQTQIKLTMNAIRKTLKFQW